MQAPCTGSSSHGSPRKAKRLSNGVRTTAANEQADGAVLWMCAAEKRLRYRSAMQCRRLIPPGRHVKVMRKAQWES